MLDSYFKLTNKSDLIHRFLYDLIRFFDNLVVADFLLGHPVRECQAVLFVALRRKDLAS